MLTSAADRLEALSKQTRQVGARPRETQTRMLPAFAFISVAASAVLMSRMATSTSACWCRGGSDRRALITSRWPTFVGGEEVAAFASSCLRRALSTLRQRLATRLWRTCRSRTRLALEQLQPGAKCAKP